MKFLGIDYGSKNVGLSMSDEEGRMAFPKETLLNTSSLVDDILLIIQRERIDEVVIGESKNLQGEDNPIMKRILLLKEKIENKGIPIHFQDELFSSQEASRSPERLRDPSGQQVRLYKNDANEATIILQSYLDKKQNKTYG